MQTQPVERPSDLTTSWLAAAIGAGDVTDFEVERIGTGQMSECYRVRLSYPDGTAGPDRPESVVLKVAASDPVSRQTGSALGLYEREVRFYSDRAAPRRSDSTLLSLRGRHLDGGFRSAARRRGAGGRR
jgi:hypothetical protein